MYPKGHPFYEITLKIRWKTNDKDTELKLICDFEESTYEAILIERHCMFFFMLSTNKQANKQIKNKWGKNSSNFSYWYANAAHQSNLKLRANGRNNSQALLRPQCWELLGACWQ